MRLLYILDQNSFCIELRLLSFTFDLGAPRPVELVFVRLKPNPSMSDIDEPSNGIAGIVGVRSGDGGAVVEGPQASLKLE